MNSKILLYLILAATLAFPCYAKDVKTDISKHIYTKPGKLKSVVFVNEKIPLNIKLYSDWLDLENISLMQKASKYLISKKFDKKPPKTIEINGVKYAVLEYCTSFFAATPGQYVTEPIVVELDVVKAEKAQGLKSPDLLNDNLDFYDDFIGAGNRRALKLEVPPETITVLPLPAEGRPEDYTGAVGSFSFEASVNLGRFNTDNIISIKMNVTGSGNYDTVSAPAIKSGAGIRAEDVRAVAGDDRVEFDQEISIGSPDVIEIPRIVFSFFDPDKRRYISIRRGPFRIAGPVTDEIIPNIAKDVDVNNEVAEKDPGKNIVGLKDSIGRCENSNVYFYKNRLLESLCLIPMILALSAALIYRRKRYMEKHPDYAELFYATRRALRSIAAAEPQAKEGECRDFYSIISAAMQEYLSCIALLPSGSITVNDLYGVCRYKVEDTALERIKKIFSDCYAAKYASVSLGNEDMVKTLSDVRYVIYRIMEDNLVKQ
jgi:hypothetical protein